MTSRRARQAALQILQMLEEFSSDELAIAVSLVGGKEGDDLLAYLAGMARSSHRSNVSREKHGRSSRRDESRLLQEIKEADPSKYKSLREFDILLRETQALPTLDDVRIFGTMLSKEFNPGKSRKESIARLIGLLAKMDMESIQAAIAKIPPKSQVEQSVFHRLANQIISGPPSPTFKS